MDLSTSHGSHRPFDFQVVILAGSGKGLYPLTNPGSLGSVHSLPKSLLPVGNKPMIEYVLSTVEEAGLRGVFIHSHYQSAAD